MSETTRRRIDLGERNPLLAYLQTVSDLIREMNFPEEVERKRLDKLLALKQELFAKDVHANSRKEADILRKIDALLNPLTDESGEESRRVLVKPEAEEILHEFSKARQVILGTYRTVAGALDRLRELGQLQKEFFSYPAGSVAEGEIREKIRQIIAGEQ